MVVSLAISIAGNGVADDAARLISLFDLPLDEQPTECLAEWSTSPSPEELLADAFRGTTYVLWEDWRLVSYSNKDKLLQIDGPVDPNKLRTELNQVHFVLAAITSWHRFAWPREYFGASFADLHYKHGWACAFKGAGHDRLVSRRWLEHGPWRLIRDDANDVSFVQFHGLDADAETALEQAKPGHQRMGISSTGGFIQTGFVFRYDWDGIYLPTEQILEIVVLGRAVEQREMLEACALRRYQSLGEERPLKNVRYVFMSEDEAHQHLHELWLRELECWAIVDGNKVRLDGDYVPPAPVKPEWVRRLDEE